MLSWLILPLLASEKQVHFFKINIFRNLWSTFRLSGSGLWIAGALRTQNQYLEQLTVLNVFGLMALVSFCGEKRAREFLKSFWICNYCIRYVHVPRTYNQLPLTWKTFKDYKLQSTEEINRECCVASSFEVGHWIKLFGEVYVGSCSLLDLWWQSSVREVIHVKVALPVRTTIVTSLYGGTKSKCFSKTDTVLS